MAIGERIHFFRLLRGMTQKYLGMAVGFPEKSADVRVAQYETGSRTPKADLTAALAQVLDVSPPRTLCPGYRLLCLAHAHLVCPGGQLRAESHGTGWCTFPAGGFPPEHGCCQTARDALGLTGAGRQAGGQRSLSRGVRPMALPLPGLRQ